MALIVFLITKITEYAQHSVFTIEFNFRYCISLWGYDRSRTTGKVTQPDLTCELKNCSSIHYMLLPHYVTFLAQLIVVKMTSYIVYSRHVTSS